MEFAKSAPATQEIEFSVRGLQAGATFTFVIDGQEVATATADARGRAEVELDVKHARRERGECVRAPASPDRGPAPA